MKTLRKRIIAALGEIELVSKRASRDFERHETLDTDGDMRRAHNLQMDGLRDAWRILSEIGAEPEDFEALMSLQKTKPKEFAAIMVLVRIELERKAGAPAQEKAA